MATSATPESQRPPGIDSPVEESPRRLGQALAALRIFVGVILFANGMSKLTGWQDVSIGWYKSFLIDRPLTRSILEDLGKSSEVPLIGRIANDLILPNWGFFQWAITAFELGVGALLIVGLASRGAALAARGMQLFLALLYFSANRWTFEQPHEYVPLVILAIVASGRVWGLDGRLLATRPDLRRWPF